MPISYNQNPMEDKPNTPYMQDLDEAEERLSFCDLPMYSDAADWEDLYTQDQTSFSSSDQQEYFEFFSEEWSSTTTTYHPRNIVFCGKLISYKEPVLPCHKSHEEHEPKIKSEKRGFFHRNSGSFTKLRTSKSRTGDEKCGFKVGKVSLVTSPSKSRWYLFTFGLTRFPTEMELSDMRRRRNRHTSSRSVGGSDKNRGKRWWGLVRALGCGGGDKYTDAMVKASLGGTL